MEIAFLVKTRRPAKWTKWLFSRENTEPDLKVKYSVKTLIPEPNFTVTRRIQSEFSREIEKITTSTLEFEIGTYLNFSVKRKTKIPWNIQIIHRSYVNWSDDDEDKRLKKITWKHQDSIVRTENYSQIWFSCVSNKIRENTKIWSSEPLRSKIRLDLAAFSICRPKRNKVKGKTIFLRNYLLDFVKILIS